MSSQRPPDAGPPKGSSQPLEPERVQLTPPEHLAEILKDALRMMRERRGLSQSELGKALGVSPTVVSEWETGTRKPSILRFLQLVELYALDLGEVGRDLAIARGGPTPPPNPPGDPPPPPAQLARLLLRSAAGELPLEVEREATEILEGAYRLIESRRRTRPPG